MAVGKSIHIGLNRVDPRHYQDENGDPWDGKLNACEADAHAMQALAVQQGFEARVILNEEATSSNVTEALREAAGELQPGDLLFVTYSGHGGQVPDANGDRGDEEDGLDETWCLYDRQFIDDELFALWGCFQAGVRILVLSDSCHSGSVVREALSSSRIVSDGPAMRALPPKVMKATYRAHKAEYDNLQAMNPAGDNVEVAASVILISGCQDNQLSMDGDKNGAFTTALLKVWNGGKYQGTTTRFWKRIVSQMPFYQSPNLFKVGAANRQFERQRPFTI